MTAIWTTSWDHKSYWLVYLVTVEYWQVRLLTSKERTGSNKIKPGSTTSHNQKQLEEYQLSLFWHIYKQVVGIKTWLHQERRSRVAGPRASSSSDPHLGIPRSSWDLGPEENEISKEIPRRHRSSCWRTGAQCESAGTQEWISESLRREGPLLPRRSTAFSISSLTMYSDLPVETVCRKRESLRASLHLTGKGRFPRSHGGSIVVASRQQENLFQFAPLI